jgi:hypothetical protein
MAVQSILKTLKSKINFPLSEESYNTALIDSDLEGDNPYTKELKRDVELCAAELILVVLTSGNVTEGGYSLTLNDKASLRTTRLTYLNRWGMPDIDPSVQKSTVSAVKGKW